MLFHGNKYSTLSKTATTYSPAHSKVCFKRLKNATVVSELTSGDSNIGKEVKVIFPYDTISFPVRNETGVDLAKGDLICLEYSIDIKNAVAVYKVS